MATSLFPVSPVTLGNYPVGFACFGVQLAITRTGALSTWATLPLSTSRGSSVQTSNNNPVTGTTTGVEITAVQGGITQPAQWVSPPIAAAVTISGTITFNIWMSETNMSANAGPQVIIDRLDSQMGVVSTIVNS